MGGYATDYKKGFWNGKWIEADTKVEPPAAMKYHWSKKASTDGMGQCSIVKGSWFGHARLTDYMCHTRVKFELYITFNLTNKLRQPHSASRWRP